MRFSLYIYVFILHIFTPMHNIYAQPQHMRPDRDTTSKQTLSEASEEYANTESFHYKYADESGEKKQKTIKSANKKDTDRKDLKKSIQRVHYEGEDEEMYSLKDQDPSSQKKEPNTKISVLKNTDTTNAPITSTDLLLHHIETTADNTTQTLQT